MCVRFYDRLAATLHPPHADLRVYRLRLRPAAVPAVQPDPAWLRSEQVDLKTIGLFALIQFPYTWKFLWSPLLDRYVVPVLGRRRGWMLLTQIGLLAVIASMGAFSPQSDLHIIAWIATLLAFLSATQDIVLDAYRRELLNDAELGLGNAVHVNAYRVAGLVPGSLSLILADFLPWSTVCTRHATDLMRALIVASAEASRTDPDGPHAVSHRVIADHLRSSCFLIADGVLPSNEGRGYVLRRIMRRAMRHAQLLGVTEPLMWKLVPALVRQMGDAYPELRRAEALVTETLKLEETRFRETLVRGLRLLDEELEQIGSAKVLPGEVAFKLYDTYGFPLDLTQDALRPKGIAVEQAGFDSAMQRQREEARKAWSGSGEKATETVWFELREEIGATEFLGYDTENAEAKVVAIIVDGKPAKVVAAGAEAAIITNQTPFYGESGGQVGDTGVLFNGAGVEFPVSDTLKKLGDMIVHFGKLARGEIKVGDVVEMKVDSARRRATRANHSATHLLHEALRRVLGEHVTQKGSMVAPERLRFDFSHPKPMTPDEISKVEEIVNRIIRQNSDVTTRLMTPKEAIEAGALALFGEKYGDEVRVLSMGVNDDTDGKTYSVELCGGTHVRRVGDIAIFKIIGESAVASGVRRIEALTGEGARHYLVDQERIAKEAAGALKIATEDLPARVASLVEERKRLERELNEAKKKLAMSGTGGAEASSVQAIGGVNVIARVLQGVNPKDLRGLVDEAKQQVGSGIVALVAVSEDGKGAIATGVTADLTTRFNAVELVKAGAEAMGGKGGGGRPDMAQAGGPDGDKADAALEAVRAVVGQLAGAA